MVTGYDVTPDAPQLPATVGSAQSALQPHQNESLVRAVTKTRDRMLLAREYPRDEELAQQRILATCKRASFAEIAIYEKPQGTGFIKGPSVRLAEEIARQWGNFDTGFKIIKHDAEGALVEVFAWDLQTNTCKQDEIYVSFKKYTKKTGLYLENKPDEQYKMVGSMASKALRNAILKTIPRDITESAYDACEATLSRVTDLKPTISRLILAWADKGITQAQLEKFTGKKIMDLDQNDVGRLRSTFIAIKDGDMELSEFEALINAKDDEKEEPAKGAKARQQKNAAKATEILDVEVVEEKKPDTGANGSKKSSAAPAQDHAAEASEENANPKPSGAAASGENSAPQQPAAASDSAPTANINDGSMF